MQLKQIWIWSTLTPSGHLKHFHSLLRLFFLVVFVVQHTQVCWGTSVIRVCWWYLSGLCLIGMGVCVSWHPHALAR